MKITRYQEECSYLSVMLNLAFWLRFASVLESGVDNALLLSVPELARGAESGDIIHIAMKFS